MFKETKKMLDTNNIFYKLLKFLSDTNTKGYEICNVVNDDGDSIHAIDIEELPKNEGEVFISTNVIEKLVSLIFDQQQQERLESSINNNKNGN